MMNWFERWMLRRILKKLIVQGYRWDGNVTDVLREINSAYERTFYEDNYYTRVANLQECFDNAIRNSYLDIRTNSKEK